MGWDRLALKRVLIRALRPQKAAAVAGRRVVFVVCLCGASLSEEHQVQASFDAEDTEVHAERPIKADLDRSAPIETGRSLEFEPIESDPSSERLVTTLEPDAAAWFLSEAWSRETGELLSAEGLAILWAHWAFETGRGHQMLGNNFAGIKGESPEGNSVMLWTRERHETGMRRVRRRFRTYSTARAGARDYVSLLAGRYPAAFRAVRRGHVNDFVTALEQGHYFTDDPGVYLRAMRSLWFEFIEESASW